MFTDVTDLCDSEAEDGDLDLESTAFSDNTDFAERTLARRETFHKHSVQLYSMSKRHAATTIGRTSPRQTRREYRVSAPPGGLGRDGSGGHCVATPEEGALSRGGCGDRHAPYIRAATHAEGIGVTHAAT